MKKFNPDKELNKIQHGNKNKIIIAVVSLLVISIIGTTYALYQVRHTKRIIYTTVSDFSRDIILNVLVNGKPQKDFPNKTEEYVYDGIECDKQDITTASWNYNLWGLELKSQGPNKCNVKFKTKETPNLLNNCKSGDKLNECLVKNKDNFENLVADDLGNNIRYIGADPNNYIWFNCTNYESPSADTCEKWRIIGVMNNVMLQGGKTTENLVKIIKAEKLTASSTSNTIIENFSLELKLLMAKMIGTMLS